MPLALVSDVHGNDDALAAVVHELGQLGVSRVVCLGDMVQGGDQPRAVLDRLAGLGWPVILGNADDFLLQVPEDPAEEITPRHLEKREWTLAQLDSTHLAQIRSFVPTLRIDGVLAFHGSPRSYDDVLLPETADDTPWHDAEAQVLAGGHTHTQWTRRIGDAIYVNPGAVMSQPAEFAIVTGRSVEFKRVAWTES